MAPRKLSESDKQEILSRYHQPEETTATLANHYGVSNSTISRILKQNLPEQEYEALIQQKRSGFSKVQTEQDYLPGMVSDIEPVEVFLAEPEVKADLKTAAKAMPEPVNPPSPPRRQRKRIITSPLEAEKVLLPGSEPSQLELAAIASEPYAIPKPDTLTATKTELLADDEFVDLEDEDLEEDDLEEDDLEDEDLEDEDLENEAELPNELGDFQSIQIQSRGKVQVLPLSEAAIPKTCYVVVDRASELITRPLKDFADLGQIPAEEVQEKTLPIFDNHRVAKRFLRRMQRIVKVPDSRIFQKVKPYLQAKGITRLLIDGQVYSL